VSLDEDVNAGGACLPHQIKSKIAPKSLTGDDLARRIKQARSELGLNQTEFAAVVGVSISTMSHWESGTFVPRKSLLERIAQVVPERYKAYFLEVERPVHQKSAVKNVSNLSTAELALLEQQKTVFVRKLRNQFRPPTEEVELCSRPGDEYF
jgi:transcriptional regulator with XRE-family HTH domain